jgi:hypothetical protein
MLQLGYFLAGYFFLQFEILKYIVPVHNFPESIIIVDLCACVQEC